MNRHLQFAGFGLASTGNGIYSTVPGLLLMFYMTNIIGIDVRYATMAIFIPKLIDVLTDPLMGMISDRTHSRWGRRRPYFLAGSLLFGPLFVLLFSSPEFNQPIDSFYFVIFSYILCTLAYTLFAVPYVAMSAEIPQNYLERTNLNAYRMCFVMIGILASGALAPLIVEANGGDRAAYRTMAIALGSIICVSWLSAFFATRKFNDTRRYETLSFKEQLKLVATNQPFITLLSAYVIQLAGMGCLTAAIAYFAIYILNGNGETIATIFICANLTALLAMPVWVQVGRKTGKLPALYLASALLAISYFTLSAFDSSSSKIGLYAIICLSGLGSGGQQLFFFSMLADTIAEGQHLKTTKTATPSSVAIYAGFFTASEKIGMAFGALIAGLILSSMGLVETTEGVTAQSAQAIRGISWAFSLAPASLILISMAVLYRYRHFDAATKTA